MKIPSVLDRSAAHDEFATLFVALELSKSTWLVAFATADEEKISQRQIAGGDSRGLLALLGDTRARIAKQSGGPVRVVCCYEAGFDGFWLHRELVAQGIENHVLDPASIAVSRRARRAKTDRLDAGALLRALMGLTRGDRHACRVVRAPSVAEEDARRPHRERERLLAEKVRHRNRIGGLLMTQGVRDFLPTRADWDKRLKSLRSPSGAALPRCLQAELVRECQRLHLVLQQIRQVEAEIAAKQCDEPDRGSRQIAHLVDLRSIGSVSAGILVREAFWRDFVNRHQVGGYFGLAPSPFNSGSSRRDQGVSKAGNPRARCVAIELAWLWLRHQPGSRLARWFHERVGTLHGRIRRILIVALARKLMVALWRYLAFGVVPEGAELKVVKA
jgi:transposase